MRYKSMVKGEGFVTQKRMDEKTIAFFLACQGYYAKQFNILQAAQFIWHLENWIRKAMSPT